MAIETFTKCIQVQNSGGSMAVTNNIRSIQMGNGYKQTASSGINTVRRQFQIVYGAKDYLEVLDFLYKHVYQVFLWTPPDGRVGVFIVEPDSIGAKPVSADVQELTCTFTEQFTSA